MPPGPGGGRSRQPRSGLFQHNDVSRTPFVTRFLPQMFLSRFPANSASPLPAPPRPGAPAAAAGRASCAGRGGAGRAARISIQLGTPRPRPPPLGLSPGTPGRLLGCAWPKTGPLQCRGSARNDPRGLTVPANKPGVDSFSRGLV